MLESTRTQMAGNADGHGRYYRPLETRQRVHVQHGPSRNATVRATSRHAVSTLMGATVDGIHVIVTVFLNPATRVLPSTQA